MGCQGIEKSLERRGGERLGSSIWRTDGAIVKLGWTCFLNSFIEIKFSYHKVNQMRE